MNLVFRTHGNHDISELSVHLVLSRQTAEGTTRRTRRCIDWTTQQKRVGVLARSGRSTRRHTE